jgi:hypothetical protein
MASPPTAVVPLPVIIAKRPIPLAAERVTAPVISDSRITSAIKRGVPGPVDGEVSIPIDRYVIAIAKLIRVPKTINVCVPCPVHRDVPFTIRVEISCPVHRHIPVAINRNVMSRAKLLFPLEIALAHPFVPGEVSLPNRGQSGVMFGHGI